MRLHVVCPWRKRWTRIRRWAVVEWMCRTSTFCALLERGTDGRSAMSGDVARLGPY